MPLLMSPCDATALLRPRYYSYLDEVVPPTQVPPCLDDCEIFVTHLPPKANSEAPGLAAVHEKWEDGVKLLLQGYGDIQQVHGRSQLPVLAPAGGGFERSSTQAHWQGGW